MCWYWFRSEWNVRKWTQYVQTAMAVNGREQTNGPVLERGIGI